MRTAYVYFQDQLAGTLKETETGYTFQYERDYLDSTNSTNLPIGINFPLREEPYTTSTIPPFFDGLIPEGWLLGHITRNWKINTKDRMGILLKACHDCIGAVSIREEPKN
jgi:serine/threonine-protein kinase HipA